MPGPRPRFLFGNAIEVLNKQLFQAQQDWEAQYGGVFRMFMLRNPIIVVTGQSKRRQMSDLTTLAGAALQRETCIIG